VSQDKIGYKAHFGGGRGLPKTSHAGPHNVERQLSEKTKKTGIKLERQGEKGSVTNSVGLKKISSKGVGFDGCKKLSLDKLYLFVFTVFLPGRPDIFGTQNINETFRGEVCESRLQERDR